MTIAGLVVTTYFCRSNTSQCSNVNPEDFKTRVVQLLLASTQGSVVRLRQARHSSRVLAAGWARPGIGLPTRRGCWAHELRAPAAVVAALWLRTQLALNPSEALMVSPSLMEENVAFYNL